MANLEYHFHAYVQDLSLCEPLSAKEALRLHTQYVQNGIKAEKPLLRHKRFLDISNKAKESLDRLAGGNTEKSLRLQNKYMLANSNAERALSLYKKYMAASIEARNKLVNSCLRLAFQLAAQRAKHPSQFAELLSIANDGVIHAVEMWNPSRGRLSTVVTPVVRNLLTDFIDHHQYSSRIAWSAVRDVKENLKPLQKKSSLTDIERRRLARLWMVQAFMRTDYISTMTANDPDFDIPEPPQEPQTFSPDSSPQTLCAADLEFWSQHLSTEERDILYRRFGIVEYAHPQSVKEIAAVYGKQPTSMGNVFRYILKKISIHRSCKCCKATFTAKLPHDQFCSQECETKGANFFYAVRVCKWCEKPFELTKKSRRQYCSTDCAKDAVTAMRRSVPQAISA